MLAAMPIRREKKTQKIRGTGELIHLFPSARTPTLEPVVFTHRSSGGMEETCSQSVLYDPINTGNQAIPNFEHSDILRMVHNVIAVVGESNTLVSKPWLSEVMRVLGRLEEQRMSLKQENAKYHLGLWAPDWDFKYPDYSPNELVRWNAAQQQWVPQ
ncbi:hypothetical protein F5Y14DRAFT_413352 [Nemania sp. NC0429]|nr:hypothetical protein F5Y14DRAFT_413352 [Nemania sp. NC0429]